MVGQGLGSTAHTHATMRRPRLPRPPAPRLTCLASPLAAAAPRPQMRKPGERTGQRCRSACPCAPTLSSQVAPMRRGLHWGGDRCGAAGATAPFRASREGPRLASPPPAPSPGSRGDRCPPRCTHSVLCWPRPLRGQPPGRVAGVGGAWGQNHGESSWGTGNSPSSKDGMSACKCARLHVDGAG